MPLPLKPDETRLRVFHEGRKRRIFIGELKYLKAQDQYEFTYDKAYAYSKRAIPLSPELDLFKLRHLSAKGKLFLAFEDRIPSRTNPAYEDYCQSQGISVDEENPIILLGFIGRRGSSTFIFEPVYEKDFSIDDVIQLRKSLDITQHDFAKALAIPEISLKKLESGKSQDVNTLQRLKIYFEFSQVALWQLRQSGYQIHHSAQTKLRHYFESIKE
jgi:DNA-binding XRE family transcriptional regulator